MRRCQAGGIETVVLKSVNTGGEIDERYWCCTEVDTLGVWHHEPSADFD